MLVCSDCFVSMISKRHGSFKGLEQIGYKNINKKGIYLALNIRNGKVYIGKTEVAFGKRIGEHFHKASRISKENIGPFDRELAKEGGENFCFFVLEPLTDIENIFKRERYWIKFYASDNPVFGYNCKTPSKTPCKLSDQKIEEIYVLLETTQKTLSEIAILYDTTVPNITKINQGRIWKHNDKQYPIRQSCNSKNKVDKSSKKKSKKKDKQKYFCAYPGCRCEISRKAKHCVKHSAELRRADYDINEIIITILEHTAEYAAQHYGISSNMLRKRLRQHHIPTRRQDLYFYALEHGIYENHRTSTEIKEIVSKLEKGCSFEYIQLIFPKLKKEELSWICFKHDIDLEKIQDLKEQKENVYLEQWSLNNKKLISVHETISEAARQLFDQHQTTSVKSAIGNISACCMGKRSSAFGFKWKYSSD